MAAAQPRKQRALAAVALLTCALAAGVQLAALRARWLVSHQPPLRPPCAAVTPPAHRVECEVLAALAAATVLRRWTRQDGWLSDAPHCTWHGVACDAAGAVTALRLDLNQLAGALPDALGELSQLCTLSLRHNGLHGTLPASLGRLAHLQQLSLSGNALSGDVPGALGGCAALRVLALSGNDVGGTLPKELASLRHLHTLSVRLTNVADVAPELCAFLASLPLCDVSGAPGTLARCGAAAASACRVAAAGELSVTRRTVRGAGGMTLSLAGAYGAFRDSSGRVYYGDAADVVVPFDVATVEALSAAVAAGAFVPAARAAAAAFLPADAAAVATLGNKASFQRFMAAHAGDESGFGAAVARHLREPPGKHDYPCVLKLTESSGGQGVFVLRNAKEYAAAAKATEGQERVLQAWAPGRTMGTAHYSLLRGRPLASVFFEAPRPRGLRIHRGGIKGYARRTTSPHAPTFEALFASLNFTGLACVNYVLDAGGARMTILEVNPRVGSSLRQAHADFRALLLPALQALEAEALQARRWAQGGRNDE